MKKGNIVVDNYHTTGYGHNFCQDYSTSGIIDGMPYIAIFDGCSGSPHSEFGSILMGMETEVFLKYLNYNPQKLKDEVIYTLYIDHIKKAICGAIQKYDLPDCSLAATVRLIFIYNNRIVFIHIGDGCTLYVHPCSDEYNVIDKTEFEAPDGKSVPVYPMNLFSKISVAQYTDKTEKYEEFIKRTVWNEMYKYSGECLTNDKCHFVDSMNIGDFEEGKHIFMVMSDGYETFSGLQGGDISGTEIEERMIKLRSGDNPVTSRFNKMMVQLNKKYGTIKHYDDISFASLIYEVR